MENKVPDWRSLKRARITLGLSIETLSKGVCSPSYLSLIENGKRPLTVRIWQKLEPLIGETLKQEIFDKSVSAYDELTSSVRLLVPPSSHSDFVIGGQIVESLRNAVNEEISGDLSASVGVYRTLLNQAVTDEQAWARTCGGSSWAMRMTFFVAEQLCRLEADFNRLEQAVQAAEPVLAIARDRHLESLDEVISLKGLIAGIHSELGNFALAEEMLDDLNLKAETDRDRALSLWLRGQLLLDRGKILESAFVLRTAAELLRGNAIKSTQFRLANAAVWSECMADTILSESALEDLTSAVAFFRANNSKSDLASCLNTLAFLAFRLGLDNLSRKCNDESRSISESLSGPRNAALQSGIAMVCTLNNEPEIALDLLRKARETLVFADFGKRAASVWAQMSNVYESLGDSASSLECLKASLQSIGVTGTPLSISRKAESKFNKKS